MKKLIYISGPITDNNTGQPREGWERAFREAEEKLREMGFEVLNPIDVAHILESGWPSTRQINPEYKDIQKPPRWLYISKCLFYMGACLMTPSQSMAVAAGSEVRRLIGLYVIGDPENIQQSYGTMCEINFALSADLPVWSQYFNGYQIDNLLRQRTDGPTLAETAKANTN